MTLPQLQIRLFADTGKLPAGIAIELPFSSFGVEIPG